MTNTTLIGLYGSTASTERQREALTSGDVPVAVYGLGKMGLPLAAVFADVTGAVTGVDVDPAVVESVNAGECHVVGEPGLSELVAEQVDRGALRATDDARRAAAEAAIHVIIVPTLITDEGGPDCSIVEDVVRDVASGLHPGDLVLVESTVPPGTCRDVLWPLLEAESGLDRGTFGLAFCPERTMSGTALEDIRGSHPKVVGGVDEESTRAAAVVYDEVTANAVQPVSDATTAEAIKVFEGVYRDVDIAIANELARASDELGVDAAEAFAVASQQPYADFVEPGPGVGGHCIPYYPRFLMGTVETPLELTRTARERNEGMPDYTVDLLEAALDSIDCPLSEATVLVCGVTYRPGVAETRATPAAPIVDRLLEAGARVYAYDPLVDVSAFGATPASPGDLPGIDLDATVVVTPHDEVRRLDWADLDPMVIVDGRNALDLDGTHHRVTAIGGGRSPYASHETRQEDGDDETVGDDVAAVGETVDGDVAAVSQPDTDTGEPDTDTGETGTDAIGGGHDVRG